MVVGHGNARFHSVIDADLALMVGLMVLPVFFAFLRFLLCSPDVFIRCFLNCSDEHIPLDNSAKIGTALFFVC